MVDFQFFRDFHEWVWQKLSNAMGGSFFRGVKFHEWAASAKIAESTYLEKTNYTVLCSISSLLIR